MLNFYHAGNCGDVIASLPFVVAKCAELNDKARYVLWTGWQTRYKTPHPLKDVQLSPEWAELLRPLLLTVPCIEDVTVEPVPGDCWRRDGFNLNLFRRAVPNLAAGDIRNWYFQTCPAPGSRSEPWLNVEPDTNFKNRLLVNVTGRYRNSQITYHFLQHFETVFVGLPDEYERFRHWVPSAAHYQAPDFLSLARAIRGSKGFVGSQSVCGWIAEGLGHPRLIESCPECPNLIPMTPNGFDTFKQDAFEEIVKWLTK